MKSMKLAALGIALNAFVSAGCVDIAAAQPDMKMSAADQKTMSSCMAMSHDGMMKDTNCTAMMARMKMSDADMQAMMACHKMPRDDMMKDKSCMSMMKMHPDMMKMTMPS